MNLSCVIPPELKAGDLHDWLPERLFVVRRFLEDLACLSSTNLYLGRVISSFGCLLMNLPSRVSVLYWAHTARAVEIVIEQHREISQLLVSGQPELEGTRQKLVYQLGDAVFLEHCRLFVTLVKPLGRALEQMAEASDACQFLAPVLDLLNWLDRELSGVQGNRHAGVCWDKATELPVIDAHCGLECTRTLALFHLGVSKTELEAEVRDVLLGLRIAWAEKWRALLSSPVMQVLLIPVHPLHAISERTDAVNAWISEQRGRVVDVGGDLDSLAGRLGPQECLGVAWEKGELELASPLGTMCVVALLANR